jgi:Transglutaminase-like superfamily
VAASIRRALRVVPGERVPPHLKLVLGVEILAVYGRMRWRMPRTHLRELVASVRDRPPTRDAGLEPQSLDARLVAARLAHAVDRTLRPLPTDSRCLVQALVLSSLLSQRGIDSTLVIGAHSKPEFAAHAWLEHWGMPVQPPEDFNESRLLEL